MRLRQYLMCAAAIAGLSLAGCSGTNLIPNTSSGSGSDGKGGQPVPSFTQFTDIPMPSNSSLDMDRSIIFGASDAWHGRKVTVVRADISVMVYDRESRVATIKLSGSSFSGSTVDVTVSPKG